MQASSSPWHHHPFRLLFVGSTVNAVGAAIAPVALAFAVLDLGGSATELGLVVAAYALTEVLTTLFGGVLGDRIARQKLGRTTSAVQAVVQGFAASSLILGFASVPLLAAIGAVNGAVAALGAPGIRALTPLTVPPAALSAALSWRRLGHNGAFLGGFAVAGMMVGFWGSGWAIAVDAATFVVALACFQRIRVPAPIRPDGAGGLLRDLAGGFAEVRAHTWLWVLILQALVYHLVFGGVQGVIGPIVVGDDFGARGWGWAMAALMAGFVIGGFVTLRWRPQRTLLWGTVLLSLTAAFPLGMLTHDLSLLLIGAFLHGFGLEIFSVQWDLAIQQNVAPDRLARVTAVDQVGSFVMRPVGLALTGPVVAVVGIDRWVLIAATVMFTSTVVALLLPSVRLLERRTPKAATYDVG